MDIIRRYCNCTTNKYAYFLTCDIKVWLEEEAEVGDPVEVKKKLAELGIYTIKHLLAMDLDKHLEFVELKPYETSRFLDAIERLKIYRIRHRELRAQEKREEQQEFERRKYALESMRRTGLPMWPMIWVM